MSLAICGIALGIEAVAGYPPALFDAAGHPVTWMGAALGRMDRILNRDAAAPSVRRGAGAAALLLLVGGSGLAGFIVQVATLAVLPQAVAVLVLGMLASACLAQRSLDNHVRAVADALDRDGLEAGRRAVGAIVGRDTAALDAPAVARAAIESLAESFADGIVAPAFWIALLGLPGGLAYKAVNTADSMIGHRTPRHAAFGFAAARLDDLVSWPGARLAALWLVLAAAVMPGASAQTAWRIMRRDARGHPSPNAGWPEAAMAGALGLKLGGPRSYGGRDIDDAFIGEGTRDADAAAIRQALRLYRLACGLQIAGVVASALLIARW